jgi:hypothetical protein
MVYECGSFIEPCVVSDNDSDVVTDWRIEGVGL